MSSWHILHLINICIWIFSTQLSLEYFWMNAYSLTLYIMYDELLLCTYILIKIEERPERILEYQIVRNLGVLRLAIHWTTLHICCDMLPNWVPQVALVVKNLLTNAGDMKNGALIFDFRRSPGLGNGNTLHYSCLETPMDRGVWLWSIASWSWPRLNRLSMHAWCQTTLYI